jgi:hypothetical protein
MLTYFAGKHWLDNKLGMYHLIFLSHMAFNILEYAKSQLVSTFKTCTARKQLDNESLLFFYKFKNEDYQ